MKVSLEDLKSHFVFDVHFLEVKYSLTYNFPFHFQLQKGVQRTILNILTIKGVNRFCGNGLYGKILTKNERIKMLGLS